MYILKYTKKFQRDAKQCKKEGRDMAELKTVLGLLKENGTLPKEFKPHLLHDEYTGYWEAHIEDDWLIIWRKKESELELLLTATGTHKQLFNPE